MAAWLYEHNGRTMNRAVAVNIGNASMCLATVVLIVAHRSVSGRLSAAPAPRRLRR
jgi:hypothetical protein